MTSSKAAGEAVGPPHAADVVRRYLAMLEAGVRSSNDEVREELEDAFVRCAADYGRQHAVSFADWRRAGVGAEVLWRAGITSGAGDG